MAVVAVGPLAMGVRYSVWASGSALRGFDGFVEGIHGPCCAFAFAFALAWANKANLDGRPLVCESVGDNGLDADAGECPCDCICDGPEGIFDVSVGDRGIVCDFVPGVSRSVASNSRAVWIARRTCDDVEDGTGLSGGAGCWGRGFTVDTEDDDCIDAELRDFLDSLDGRSIGYVTTDAESAPYLAPLFSA